MAYFPKKAPVSLCLPAGPRFVWLAPAALVLLFVACAHNPGNFVWVDDFPPPPPPDERGYVIAEGDVLYVKVFNQEHMSGRVKVRSDGMVSLTFLGDVEAAGYTPSVLAEQLQTRLKDLIVNPVVTISLEETRPVAVSVVGEVAKPGIYNLEPASGVLNALASAGGMTEYASRDRIYVLRQAKQLVRIRFTYEALAHAEGRAGTFRLQPNDIVVVE